MKNEKETPSLREYRKDCIKAAKELLYSSEIIVKLRRAKSISELTRIMTDARKSS